MRPDQAIWRSDIAGQLARAPDTFRVISRTATGDHELVFVEPTEAKAAKRCAILERQGFVAHIERIAAPARRPAATTMLPSVGTPAAELAVPIAEELGVHINTVCTINLGRHPVQVRIGRG